MGPPKYERDVKSFEMLQQQGRFEPLKKLKRVKDSPAIIAASGLAGVLGAFFPTAQGWVLEKSIIVMDMEVSARSLGLFAVSKLLFLPATVVCVLGLLALKPKFATRKTGILAIVASLGTMGAWFFQKSTIDQLSVMGVGPAIGLFLLLVSGLGGLLGGSLLVAFPPKKT